ncbi:hypothetical protein AVEN_612-1 [Araneus ventricosus]|uniref:Integrase catalytic domain-containing protein n=1 Tax=Araneus ventricosus TaxID=182803 RepID=A0A4Y2EKE4_ARAVE|nr:hypothetical protein AVEN_612-1 [Araneus ventricosus]
MKYKDHASKFCLLRPLKTNRAAEVARCVGIAEGIFGPRCPLQLSQSDNGQKFIANVISDLSAMWPDCKIVHGRPRHPHSQGSAAIRILKICYGLGWTIMEVQIG